jgi:hypothetical protein
MDQASYARLHGIRPRTLRLWREQFQAACAPVASDGFPPGDATVAIDALGAALDAARAAVAACRSSLDAAAACRSVLSPGGVDEEPVGMAHVDDAGGMPVEGRAEVEAVLATGVEHNEQVAPEPIVRPDDEQAPPTTPSRRRRSFFDFLDD